MRSACLRPVERLALPDVDVTDHQDDQEDRASRPGRRARAGGRGRPRERERSFRRRRPRKEPRSGSSARKTGCRTRRRRRDPRLVGLQLGRVRAAGLDRPGDEDRRQRQSRREQTQNRESGDSCPLGGHSIGGGGVKERKAFRCRRESSRVSARVPTELNFSTEPERTAPPPFPPDRRGGTRATARRRPGAKSKRPALDEQSSLPRRSRRSTSPSASPARRRIVPVHVRGQVDLARTGERVAAARLPAKWTARVPSGRARRVVEDAAPVPVVERDEPIRAPSARARRRWSGAAPKEISPDLSGLERHPEPLQVLAVRVRRRRARSTRSRRLRRPRAARWSPVLEPSPAPPGSAS